MLILFHHFVSSHTIGAAYGLSDSSIIPCSKRSAICLSTSFCKLSGVAYVRRVYGTPFSLILWLTISVLPTLLANLSLHSSKRFNNCPRCWTVNLSPIINSPLSLSLHHQSLEAQTVQHLHLQQWLRLQQVHLFFHFTVWIYWCVDKSLGGLTQSHNSCLSLFLKLYTVRRSLPITQ